MNELNLGLAVSLCFPEVPQSLLEELKEQRNIDKDVCCYVCACVCVRACALSAQSQE